MSGGNEAWGGTEMQSDCLILLLYKTKKNPQNTHNQNQQPNKSFQLLQLLSVHQNQFFCIKLEINASKQKKELTFYPAELRPKTCHTRSSILNKSLFIPLAPICYKQPPITLIAASPPVLIPIIVKPPLVQH